MGKFIAGHLIPGINFKLFLCPVSDLLETRDKT
jgi:hypothetical protein